MKKYKQVSIFNKNSIFISRIDKPNDDKYVMYKKDRVDLDTGHYSFKKIKKLSKNRILVSIISLK